MIKPKSNRALLQLRKTDGVPKDNVRNVRVTATCLCL